MKRRVLVGFAVLCLAAIVTVALPVRADSTACQLAVDAFCYQPAAEQLVNTLQNVTEPSIAVPAWLEGQ